MMGWFRERRRLKLFSRAWRQATEEEFSKGNIVQSRYDTCLRASKNPKAMKRLMAQTETAPGLYGGIKDWDWEAIYEWVKTYFIPLMKALLPLLLILDEEK